MRKKVSKQSKSCFSLLQEEVQWGVFCSLLDSGGNELLQFFWLGSNQEFHNQKQIGRRDFFTMKYDVSDWFELFVFDQNGDEICQKCHNDWFGLNHAQENVPDLQRK